MQDPNKSRRGVLKKIAGTATLGSVALTGGAAADDVSTQTYVCEGSKDCPPPAGECDCWYECRCDGGWLLKRECCCCDDDDRNGCADWVYEGECF